MRLSRPLLAAVVLPLVVIVGFQTAWAAYACGSDGRVRDHCCCKQKKSQSDGVAHLARQRCCAMSINALPDQPVARAPERASFDAAVPVAPMASLPVVAPPVERVISLNQLARPPPRTALYLDKQSLLR